MSWQERRCARNPYGNVQGRHAPEKEQSYKEAPHSWQERRCVRNAYSNGQSSGGTGRGAPVDSPRLIGQVLQAAVAEEAQTLDLGAQDEAAEGGGRVVSRGGVRTAL